MSRIGLALRAARLTVSRATADPTPDYDLASGSYDDYFTRVMGGHGVGLLDAVMLRPGMTVLELACGTGHLTAEIARRLQGRGELHAVDRSPGMLEVARAKVPPSPGLKVKSRASMRVTAWLPAARWSSSRAGSGSDTRGAGSSPRISSSCRRRAPLGMA